MNSQNLSKKLDPTEEQILLSLDYLTREAKKNNSHELYELLNTAKFLAREHNTDLNELVELFEMDEGLTASMLLVKFLKIGNKDREYILENIENNLNSN